jgi:hypothetical protein
MIRIYRDYAHDANISYGQYGRANQLDIAPLLTEDRGNVELPGVWGH